MIDLSTRWLEVIQLRSMEASTCADDLIVSRVAIHDRPTTITSEHSLQYVLFHSLGHPVKPPLEVHHIYTIACLPQSTGMVKSAHCQLKHALSSHLACDKWPQHLLQILQGLYGAPRKTAEYPQQSLFSEPS